MKTKLLVLIIFTALVYSCGGGGKPGVFVDGKKIDLPHGLAVKGTKYKGYTLYLFNMKKTQCENVMSSSGRVVPKGEITVRLFIRDKNTATAGIGSHNQLMVNIELVTEPKNPGDKIVMNVPSVITMKPRIGKFKGKTVTIQGKFEGKYCGPMN